MKRNLVILCLFLVSTLLLSCTKPLPKLPIKVVFEKPMSWPHSGLIVVLTNRSDRQMNMRMTLRRPSVDLEEIY